MTFRPIYFLTVEKIDQEKYTIPIYRYPVVRGSVLDFKTSQKDFLGTKECPTLFFTDPDDAATIAKEWARQHKYEYLEQNSKIVAAMPWMGIYFLSIINSNGELFNQSIVQSKIAAEKETAEMARANKIQKVVFGQYKDLL